ncbi:MAG: hypothetical protein AAFV19_14430 [Pseudomonadota bacterium]
MLRGILMLAGVAVIIGGLAVAKFSPETVEALIPDETSSLPPAVTLGTAALDAVQGAGEAVISAERREQIAEGLSDPDRAAETYSGMTPLERLFEADRVVRDAKAGFDQEAERNRREPSVASTGAVTAQPSQPARPREDPIDLQVVKLIEASPDKRYLAAKLTEWTSRGMRMPEVLKRMQEHERAREAAAKR